MIRERLIVDHLDPHTEGKSCTFTAAASVFEKVQNCVLVDAVVCSILELREGVKSDSMFLPLNDGQTGGL